MKFAGSLVQYTCTKIFSFTGILLGADLVNKRAEHLFATRTCWRKVLQFLLTKDFYFIFCATQMEWSSVVTVPSAHIFVKALWFLQMVRLSNHHPFDKISIWVTGFGQIQSLLQPESSPSSSVALLWVQDKIMGHLQCYKYMSILNCPSRESWMHNAIFIS